MPRIFQTKELKKSFDNLSYYEQNERKTGDNNLLQQEFPPLPK